MSDLKSVIVDIARLSFWTHINVSMLKHISENHPEIFQKAMFKAFEEHKDKLEALVKAVGELENAKIQEENNQTNEL